MNIYRVERHDDADEGEAQGFIITAKDEDDARSAAADTRGSESASEWTSPARSSVVRLGTADREVARVELSSRNGEV